MGDRGPSKKPTNLKILQGNPGKRKISDGEPKPNRGNIICPSHLSKDAKKVWKQLVPKLKALDLITELDVREFAKYCIFEAQFIRSSQFVDKHGETYPIKDEKGALKCVAQFPQVSIMRNAAKVCSAFSKKFGLTPGDRAGIELPSKEELDPFEELMKRKNV